MKNKILILIIWVSAQILRSRAFKAIHQWTWNRICINQLNWRSVQANTATADGTLFRCEPTDFVENRILFFGVWEPSITHQFRNILDRGDIVIDIGANIGYYTLLASKLIGPSGHVYAFEPSAEIRQRLQYNINMNSAHNLSVIPKGAWNTKERMRAHIVDGNRGSSGVIRNTVATKGTEFFELDRVDQIIPKSHIDCVKLIKIDVEGAELQALQGCDQILRDSKSVSVICEVNPQELQTQGGVEALIMYMTGMDFDALVIPNDYSAEAYMKAQPEEARELKLPIESPCDILFKKRNSTDI